MIKIELMVHDLIQLGESLRNNKDKIDIVNELQQKIEETEKEIFEANKLIDDSPIFQKTNEPI
ncbi:MAG: hypothetical protein IH843_05130, partial [Thaumarchaeota archaeon]|nr:hypothetical protein [Nitrososphaerota archaeon]